MAYRVEPSESAGAEAIEAYLWMKENRPSFADKWFNGLIAALNSLQEFPGRCPLAPENSAVTREVRQLLYGKGRTLYRILFTVREETVYVLHIRHSARPPMEADEIHQAE